MPDAVVIMTTVDSDELARSLAAALLESRLAACVQQSPIVSRFRWKKALQEEREILLLVKTSAEAGPAAARLIEERHSYDVPEVLVLPVTEGSRAYLDWIAEEASGPAE